MKVNLLTQLLENSLSFKKEYWDTIKQEIANKKIYNDGASIVKWLLDGNKKDLTLPPKVVYTVRDSRELVGYAGIGMAHSIGDLCVFVNPNYKGQGLDKKLCGLALDNFKGAVMVLCQDNEIPWLDDLIHKKGFLTKKHI